MNAPDRCLPPHNMESEQSLLGALLIGGAAAWDRVADRIADADFYRDEHRRIFRAIQRLQERGKPADVVTVAEALDSAGETEHTGGLAYLGDLAQNTPSAANIVRYAEIVRDRRIRRDVLAIGHRIADLAASAGSNTGSLVEQATGLVMELADTRHAGREPQSIAATAADPTLADAIVKVADLLTDTAGTARRLSGHPEPPPAVACFHAAPDIVQ